MTKLKLGIILALLLALGIFSAVLAAGPSGAGPHDALMVTGQTQSIAANTSLWFYFDYVGDRTRAKVTLNTFGASNVQMGIYTPAQARAYLSDPGVKPVGVGTQPGSASADAIYDLTWLGGFNFAGRFFVAIANNNPAPVNFRLNITGDAVALGPTPTPTPLPSFPNPFAVAITPAVVEGKFVFQEASGGYIYTVSGDGSKLMRVASGLDPAWSPDSARIAFARWGDQGGLYLVNADGTNVSGVFASPQILSPRWRADGKRIAFAQQLGGSEERVVSFFGRPTFFPADPWWKIGVFDVESGAFTQPPSTKHSFAPTWSQDGNLIAFADAGFGILTTDTTTRTIASLYTQNPQVQSASWSPDGSRIAFQVRAHDHWEIATISADGLFTTAVTRADALSFTLVNNVAPAWSPDGKQIVFLSDRNGKWEFFVVNSDGSNLRQVLKNVTDQIPIQYNFSNERVMDWTK